MPDNPDGFEENPQAPFSADDEEENVIDESIWGPQKKLTAEEQASYDAWFRKKVQASLDYAKRPDAVFYTHEEVMARMRARIATRIAEAQKLED
ncbi:antitoxin PaaA2 family protein [Rhizobium sp. LjRoot254]|uniref:antitoxin PaaA2 family protein n=1 Tax=Rhizobium sp. LjRoot254 TaxID=3342297 RepID=UPI003ECD9CD1